jgi:tripartite-type tricarboxylate transporter receptor subunit TctC
MKNALTAAAAWAFVVMAAMPGAAQQQQEYPAKPVRVIVSFPPGSTPDIVARTIAPVLHQALGQPFIVENRSGAAGNAGADAVAKATPDGHTLLVSTNGPVAINHLLYQHLPYDPMRDLAPITLLVRAPQILVAGAEVPARDFPSFIAYAKANPGKISYGSVGNGSASHLAMEDLKLKTGIDVVHVPYRGFPAAVTDLVGGEIQTMFVIASGVLAQIEAGKVKALAIAAEKRWPAAPGIPTLGELGLAGAESYAWIGLLAPAKTPPEVIARLNAAAGKALLLPEPRAALEKQGFEIVASSTETFDEHRRAEAARWGGVIQRMGIKAE